MFYPTNPVNNFYYQHAQSQMFQPNTQCGNYPMQNNLSQPQVIARPVTNIEEAKAAMIEPFTSYVFLDSSTGNIYLKQMNNKGMSDFYIYSQKDCTKEKDQLEIISERLSRIENTIGDLIYGKSISNVPGNTESGKYDPKSDVAKNATSESGNVSEGTTDDEREKRKRT